MSETYIVELNRLEEGFAFLLTIEDDSPDEEVVIDAEEVPEEYRERGTIMDVEIADGHLVEAERRPELEKERKKRIEQLKDEVTVDADDLPDDV